MTINLTNSVPDAQPIDQTFTNGYIPLLVLKLVTGQLDHIGVSAIMFSKTIVAKSVSGGTNIIRTASGLSQGYRVRVISDKSKPIGGFKNNMRLVREYIEQFPYDEDCYEKLADCVVKITQC